ncbi:NIF-domain-containing protein [Ascodesmis nigricans]|uniref:Mitochondrial import inner membrane translocase subunit TIM50 n=1 Tax=Ascodesmis nigricans TaxID=341454 RepID=A0A4S2N3W2_9PEZI|nr:NIF-domain-containing protein [Ascodesmis nigricans]
MLSRHLARSLRAARLPLKTNTPLRSSFLHQTRAFADKPSPAVPRVVRLAQERAARAARGEEEPSTTSPEYASPTATEPPADTHPAEAEPILPTDANAEPLINSETTARPADTSEFASEAASEAAESAEGAARKAGAGGKGGDHIPKSAYISSSDRRRQRNFRYMGLFGLASVVGFILYMGRPFEPIEKKIHPDVDADSLNPADMLKRINARRKDILDFYNEPPFDKLLPDMVPEYGRPFTLVLSLEDLMVHSEWTREHGWRIAKRPGLDYFLGYLFQYFEIVVFTNQPDATAAPIIQKVDPSPGYIMYPLFRAHTKYVDGKYVKDLNYLNRDLKKVIMLESNPDAWSANPDNTIKMKPWKGEKNDKELVALIPFLEYIAALNVDDVRDVIRDYDGTHIPTEFARREAKLREELRKQLPQKKKGKQPPAWLLTAVGMKPKEEKEEEDVKTFMDMVRERGQQTYIETQRHIMEHKEEMEREQKKAEKEMADQMKTSLSKIFTEGLPKPPGQ